jgi:hypothetical protein
MVRICRRKESSCPGEIGESKFSNNQAARNLFTKGQVKQQHELKMKNVKEEHLIKLKIMLDSTNNTIVKKLD